MAEVSDVSRGTHKGCVAMCLQADALGRPPGCSTWNAVWGLTTTAGNAIHPSDAR